MADTEEPKQESQQEDNKTEKGEKKSLISRLLPILIIVFVMGFCACAGLFLGRMLGGPSSTQAAESDANQVEPTQPTEKAESNSADSSEGVWYYDLEPVVANLNEPNVARYISISITLQISSDLSEKSGRSRIEQKLPVLTDWLTVYLAGLGLEDIRGDKNLKSVQAQILDAFNTKLFPDSKPMIKHILFRNFAVQ